MLVWRRAAAFRVWAPNASGVSVQRVVGGASQTTPLAREGGGV
jgi:1,4-alpha-glucan branching enzyme